MNVLVEHESIPGLQTLNAGSTDISVSTWNQNDWESNALLRVKFRFTFVAYYDVLRYCSDSGKDSEEDRAGGHQNSGEVHDTFVFNCTHESPQ